MFITPQEYKKLDIPAKWNCDKGMYQINPEELTRLELKSLIANDLPKVLERSDKIKKIKKARRILMIKTKHIEISNSAARIRRVLMYSAELDDCWTRAKTHWRGCTISFNDVLDQVEKQNYCCALTGIEFSEANRPSIDRIDSRQGYHPWNIQIVLIK